MEEKSPDTLKKIEQAAMEEFSDKGFLGASLRQIVKKSRRYHRGVLWLFFQQRGFIHRHCGTTRRRTYGKVYGGPDFLC